MIYSNHVSVRDITVEGVPLTVEFEFYKGYEDTEFEPGQSDHIDICCVFVDEIEVTHLLGQQGLDKIEKELWRVYDNKEEV